MFSLNFIDEYFFSNDQNSPKTDSKLTNHQYKLPREIHD